MPIDYSMEGNLKKEKDKRKKRRNKQTPAELVAERMTSSGGIGGAAERVVGGDRSVAIDKNIKQAKRTPTVLDSVAGVPDDEVERTRNRKRQALRYRRSGRVGTMLSQGSGLG